MKKDCCKGFFGAKGLMTLSWACVILAAIGATGVDFYLASTQWILLAILFAVYSLWLCCH